MADAQTPAIQSDVLQGVLAGLAGYRSVPHAEWLRTYERLQATDDEGRVRAALELAYCWMMFEPLTNCADVLANVRSPTTCAGRLLLHWWPKVFPD